MGMERILSILIILVVISGCTSSIEVERVIVDSNYTKEKGNTLSPPLLIAADLQIHFIYNSINTRNNFFNYFSESIRPVAADIFAPDHFDTKIQDFQESFPNGKLILLGDVLDVSCDWESEKFFNMMKGKANWVLAPGNHDFIFLGTHENKERTTDWVNGCEETGKGDRRFNKVEFIFTYLEALAEQETVPNSDPSYSSFSRCLESARKNRRVIPADNCLNNMKMQRHSNDDNVDRDCPAYKGLGDQWVNCKVASNIPDRFADMPNQGWWKNKDPLGYLQDVFWYINPADEDNEGARESYYSYSYIIQRVRMPDGRYAMLLDTNNPAQLRSVLAYPIGYNPANSANMLYSQMNAASILMGGNNVFTKINEESQNIKVAEEVNVLMSHHPIDDYRFEAKKGLCLLANVGNVKSIYTAHTHNPSTKNHKSLHWRLPLCTDMTEYNIGSMIDAPLEYMIVTKESEGEIFSRTVDLSEEYKSSCFDVENKWKQRAGEEFHYTSYNDLGWFASETDIHLNLIKTVVTHFIKMLDETEGFQTTSTNWPTGVNSDDLIKRELLQIRIDIQNNKLTSKYRDRLIEFSKFFSERKVKDMANINRYKSCQLHWASAAKNRL